MKYDVFFTSYTTNVYVDLMVLFFQNYIANNIFTYSTCDVVDELLTYYNVQSHINILSLDEYYENHFNECAKFKLQMMDTHLGKLSNNILVGKNKSNITYETYNMYTYLHLIRDIKFEFFTGYDLHSIPYKYNQRKNTILFNLFKYLRGENP